MCQPFSLQRLFFSLLAVGVMGCTQNIFAAAFQLFEQDAASIGNYHAGRAAIADDASTAYYNPAGLIRFNNQQIIVGGAPIFTDIRFNGTVDIHTNADHSPLLNGQQSVAQQAGGFVVIPFFHYVSPVSERVGYGMSVVEPFKLKTDYGHDSMVRYIATLTSIQIIDVSPALGFAINDKLSLGLGLNIQFLTGEFNSVVRGGGIDITDISADTISRNRGDDHAFGYHVGVLYQLQPCTRLGISYQSKITHHFAGRSHYVGFLASNGTQTGSDLAATLTLPPITSASIFHTLNHAWDVMGTVTYTQWGDFNHFTLKNVAGFDAVNDLTLNIQQGYHNAWNYAVGTQYHPTDCWLLRTGLGYDQSPVNDRHRNLQLPDSDRVALALGAHYQYTKALGFDLGWTHLFMLNTRINRVEQRVGDERTLSNGAIKAGTDIYGAQVKWDIA